MVNKHMLRTGHQTNDCPFEHELVSTRGVNTLLPSQDYEAERQRERRAQQVEVVIGERKRGPLC